MTRYFDKVG